jgi:tetratricopeptide (TPR) repeat protein
MAYSREIEKLERQFAENPRRFAAPFADALRKSDEVERALEVIRVGLELNPDYIPGSVILGRCHLDLGDDNSAEAAFSRVLDLDNENVIALKSLADIMERQGRNDEAVRFLTYLLDVDRSNDEAREQLARIQAAPVVAGVPRTPPAPVAPPVAETPAAATLPDPFFGAPPGETPPAPAATAEEFLEPTALWEPPVEAAEAGISPWVEPTSVEPASPPEFGESLVSEPAAGEFAPVEGLEDSEFRTPDTPPSYQEFVLEREEEIILTSHSGAEYQVANDSESFLDREPAVPPPAEEPPPPVSLIAEEIRTPGGQATPPAVDAVEAVDEETPIEWAMHVGEDSGFVPAEASDPHAHAKDSHDAAIEGIVPVDEDAPVDDADDDEEAAAPGVPVLVVTESMAELYAAQGHPGEALGVYRILYDRNPDNDRLRHRIQELESALAAQVAADAAPSYAASVTGGRAVAEFLGGMLKARPAPVDLPEPPPAPELASTAGLPDTTSDEAVASGAPTRPAIDRLSLGAIFGEDPSPVPPAEAAAAGSKNENSSGFSFDDFFGGGGESSPTSRPSGGSVRATRAADDEDDLDQFHSWLQSLKR